MPKLLHLFPVPKKTLFQSTDTVLPTPVFAKKEDVVPKYTYRMYKIHVSSKKIEKGKNIAIGIAGV